MTTTNKKLREEFEKLINSFPKDSYGAPLLLDDGDRMWNFIESAIKEAYEQGRKDGIRKGFNQGWIEGKADSRKKIEKFIDVEANSFLKGIYEQLINDIFKSIEN